jgi:molybdate transport system permease protein
VSTAGFAGAPQGERRASDRRERPWWVDALGRATLIAGAASVIAVVVAFLVLPIVGLITYQPVHDLIHNFGTKVATDAILVSLKTNAIAFAIMVAFGTPFAYLIARHRFPGRSIVLTIVEVPLVMPPAVAGLGLLVAFGRFGLLGHTLSVLGIDLAFTQAAVVVAILFVSSPFYLRFAVASFEAVDSELIDVAATLGAGPVRRMLRVAIPLAAGGLGAGAALAFARGVGEFGATILFAGSLQGTTQTLPLAVYGEFDVNLDQAVAIGVLLIIVAAAILLASKLLIRSWTTLTSTSPSRAGRSSFASP